MAVRVTLKPHREAVEALERDGFVVTPVRFGKGDHLILEASRDGATVRTTISGSPRGGFLRAMLGAVRSAHRARLGQPA